MYITPAQLADRPGALEIAQVATPEREPIVDAALMDAVLRGNDLSGWQPADVAVADLALANVQAAIDDADSVIDGYLAKRYPLPLASTPPILATYARALARYNLHKNRQSLEANDPIVRDQRDAMKFLMAVASGALSLGATDPALTDAAQADVQFETCDSVFGRDQMRRAW